MNIDHLVGNFEKRRVKNDLVYSVGRPAYDEQIIKTESELGEHFPNQLKLFYGHYNGLMVKEPQLEIFKLEKLKKEGNLIQFAVINNNIKICFDCTRINIANQWDIIKCDDGFIITLTLSSFWSNKIWAWIDKKREIWKDCTY